MKNIWTQIEQLEAFATDKLAEMKKANQSDAWFTFDDSTDVHIEEMDDSPVGGWQAIAYPLDEKGNAILDSFYIQVF